VVILYSGIWFLKSGIKALSLGKYFLFLHIFFRRRKKRAGATIFYFLQIFFFREKKRAATFSKFSVYFCAKFAEKGCISEFLSEKHLI
jgi:hypothetical protein